jgi:hypothetical protein
MMLFITAEFKSPLFCVIKMYSAYHAADSNMIPGAHTKYKIKQREL